MLRTVLSIWLAAISAGTLTAFAQDAAQPAAKVSPFNHFKALAGEWTGKANHDGHEMDAVVTYKVTSGGSAVMETIGPGSDHEMVTLIHPDGDKLALTHYCAVGNQPQMAATPKAGETKFAFDFVRGGNMKSDQDTHMHSVTYTFIDKDTLKSEWTLYTKGKASGKAVFELKRKK